MLNTTCKLTVLAILCTATLVPPTLAANTIQLETERFNPACSIEIQQKDHTINVRWPIDDARHGQMTFDLNEAAPLIESIGVIVSNNAKPTNVCRCDWLVFA